MRAFAFDAIMCIILHLFAPKINRREILYQMSLLRLDRCRKHPEVKVQPLAVGPKPESGLSKGPRVTNQALPHRLTQLQAH